MVTRELGGSYNSCLVSLFVLRSIFQAPQKCLEAWWLAISRFKPGGSRSTRLENPF